MLEHIQSDSFSAEAIAGTIGPPLEGGQDEMNVWKVSFFDLLLTLLTLSQLGRGVFSASKLHQCICRTGIDGKGGTVSGRITQLLP